jgi:hypothetical protein
MGMTTQALSPLSYCAEICGLTAREMIVGASARPEHEHMAAYYFRCSSVDQATMRRALVAAIRAALQSSETRLAADLLVALRMMLEGQRVHLSAGRRRSRGGFYRSRRAVEGLIETDHEERATTGEVIVNLAERRINRGSGHAVR